MTAPGLNEAPQIEDYAIIGDCRTCALVSRLGSIDWLCLPRFDSPAVFAALLDRDRGGQFSIRPVGFSATRRRYLPGTNVLETTFHSPRGVLRVTDFMPAGCQQDSSRVCRIVECTAGECEVHLVCDPRPGYGAAPPTRHGEGTAWSWFALESALHLQTTTPLRASPQGSPVTGVYSMSCGDAQAFELSATAVDEDDLLAKALRERDHTARWWERWSGQLRYTGAYRQQVLRSALALKLLSFDPTGALIAAPTTSLPEVLGGARNWDYRYCWLRDASMSVRALLECGFAEEAHRFIQWLFRYAASPPHRLPVLCDVDGQSHLPEAQLENLRGYADSRPVRVGNAAHSQLQLDTYGALIDALYGFYIHGGKLFRSTGSLLQALGDQVCDLWEQPDSGIWETRLGTHHHTLSKAMCWVALNRLLTMHADSGLPLETTRWAQTTGAIRRAIEAHGVAAGGYFKVSFGQEQVDPSLLLLGLYGYEPIGSLRMLRTLRRIDECLGPPPFLRRRLAVGPNLGENTSAFGIAGFWAVECLAEAGLVDEAIGRFEAVLASGNDVGLFSEEFDPTTGLMLGNFPQAFTHTGLMNAARALGRAQGQEQPGERHDPRTEHRGV